MKQRIFRFSDKKKNDGKQEVKLLISTLYNSLMLVLLILQTFRLQYFSLQKTFTKNMLKCIFSQMLKF